MADLKRKGTLRSSRVEAAFHAVPRHLFVPDVPLSQAYTDRVISAKRVGGQLLSSSSQPSIMALMLEQLDLRPGQRVLEVGAGTGYNAALLAHLVGEGGRVVSLEVDPELAERARERLARAGGGPVEVICADGGAGHEEGAPYDRIILTAGVCDLTPAWWAQLAPGGALVAPLAVRTCHLQVSVALHRQGEQLEKTSLHPCLFMMLRGRFGGPCGEVQLDEAGLALAVDDPLRVEPAAVRAWLKGDSQRHPTGVRARGTASLALWLALHEPGFFYLLPAARATDHAPSPALRAPQRLTSGALANRGLCLLDPPPTSLPPGRPYELSVRDYGAQPALARRVVARVRAWAAAGRPGWEDWCLRAVPAATRPGPARGEVLISRRWSHFLYRLAP